MIFAIKFKGNHLVSIIVFNIAIFFGIFIINSIQSNTTNKYLKHYVYLIPDTNIKKIIYINSTDIINSNYFSKVYDWYTSSNTFLI